VSNSDRPETTGIRLCPTILAAVSAIRKESARPAVSGQRAVGSREDLSGRLGPDGG